MPFPAQNVIELVLAMAAVVALATGLLIAFAVGRRRHREKHFERLDALREEYGPVIAEMLAGDLDYLSGLAFLNQLRGPAGHEVLERLCLQQQPKPDEVPVLRRLCEDLGLVQLWQRDLAGSHGWELIRDSFGRPGGLLRHISELSFLVRAKAAENLRLIRHSASWPLLARALKDPHADVQEVAARALGTVAAAESFPALVDRLHAVVLKPGMRLSVATVKAALVSFPLEQAVDLAPSLNYPHPRIRFLATDIIRMMVEQRAGLERDFVLSERVFPREVAEIFLFRLPFDPNPDVRARAAPVIARLPETPRRGASAAQESRPSDTLLRLLDDPQWFVRLHAARALAKLRYAPQAPKIARRLTDPDWRVREAATKALVALGQDGVDQLVEHLVDTHDRYSQEQAVETLEQAGLISPLLAEYAKHAGVREGRMLERFVNLGKINYLERLLQNGAGPDVRRRFWMDFKGHPDRRIHAWAKRITGN